jgi:hypothetical protein
VNAFLSGCRHFPTRAPKNKNVSWNETASKLTHYSAAWGERGIFISIWLIIWWKVYRRKIGEIEKVLRVGEIEVKEVSKRFWKGLRVLKNSLRLKFHYFLLFLLFDRFYFWFHFYLNCFANHNKEYCYTFLRLASLPKFSKSMWSLRSLNRISKLPIFYINPFMKAMKLN